MPDKEQVFIFNNDELRLIKDVFSENDELLYSLRKVFLQFPVTQLDRDAIKAQVTPAMVHILRKRILPTPSNEFPFGQISGILTTLTADLKVKTAEEMELAFRSKQLQIKYLGQRFQVIENICNDIVSDSKEIMLADLGKLENKNFQEQYVDVSAYLFILGFIDPCLMMIKAIAGKKDETIEQLTARMTRDSAK